MMLKDGSTMVLTDAPGPILENEALVLVYSELEPLNLHQHIFSEDRDSRFRYMSFSLMDQTSYVFLMFSKSQFSHVVHFSMNVKKSCAGQLNSDLVHEQKMAKVFGYTTSESIAMRTQGSWVKTNKANQF
ncbi:unnamed protein product, partial [Vitis vinifera]